MFDKLSLFQVCTDLRHNAFRHWNDSLIKQYSADETLNVALLAAVLCIDLRENDWVCDCEFYNLVEEMSKLIVKYNKGADVLRVKCGSPSHLAGKEVFYEVNKRELCPSSKR